MRRHKLEIPNITFGGDSIVRDGFYSNFKMKLFEELKKIGK